MSGHVELTRPYETETMSTYAIIANYVTQYGDSETLKWCLDNANSSQLTKTDRLFVCETAVVDKLISSQSKFQLLCFLFLCFFVLFSEF